MAKRLLLKPTTRQLVQRGHQLRRHTLIMRDKRQRRGKDKLRRDLWV